MKHVNATSLNTTVTVHDIEILFWRLPFVEVNVDVLVQRSSTLLRHILSSKTFGNNTIACNRDA